MRRFLSLAAIIAFATPPLHAQTSSRLAPLEFLLGSCWRGSFPGNTQTDEHCFESVFDRKFVRDRHVVRGGQPYGGETIYYWDEAQKRVAFSYWNTEGQMMHGFVASASADSIAFVIGIPSQNGTTEMRSRWALHGADGYRVTQLQRSGDSWKEIYSMDMKRAPRNQ